MTPAQLQRFRARLKASRQPIERSPWSNYAHPRGWNDCLDFVERTIRDITGEAATAEAYIEGRKA